MLAVGGWFFNAGGYPMTAIGRSSFTGSPAVAVNTEPQTIDPNQDIVLLAKATGGALNTARHWFRNGVPLNNGPQGASPGGGRVVGAGDAFVSPTNLS